MKMILMILKQKSNHKNSIKRNLFLTAHLLHSNKVPPSLFLLLKCKHLPCQDHLLLGHLLLYLYGHPDLLQVFLLDHLQELLHS